MSAVTVEPAAAAPGVIMRAADTAFVTPIDAVALLTIAILALLTVTGVAIISSRRLFAVVMLSGAYSLLSATFFVVTDAVDVAFTEAAVGAGISTALMLGAMLLTAREARPSSVGRHWTALLVCVAVGVTLLYATGDMPAFGDPESPVNAYLGRAYLVRTPLEVDVPNVVTAVLASYRGFDTLGETVVVFTAGLGVMLLLGLRNPLERGRDAMRDQRRARRNDDQAVSGDGDSAPRNETGG